MTYPYISGPGNIAKMVTHLRKSFPQTIDADTVKKLRFAPNNESYLINALQFLNVIDDKGNKTEQAKIVFSQHKDENFQKEFSLLVRDSYSELFDLHGDEAWTLSKNDLIGFFRQTDDTSDAIGTRQAGTFLIMSMLSGHNEPLKLQQNTSAGKKQKITAKSTKSNKTTTVSSKEKQRSSNSDFALTVRVEVNLPSDGSKETYDSIFKSIRENLMNDQ